MVVFGLFLCLLTPQGEGFEYHILAVTLAFLILVQGARCLPSTLCFRVIPAEMGNRYERSTFTPSRECLRSFPAGGIVLLLRN